MSREEKYAWASLVGLGVVFWWFQMRMLDGFSIVDQTAPKLLYIYFVTIAASTIFEIIIGAVLARKKGQGVDKDERDHAIAARANQNERVFMICAINVLVWQALWEGAIEGHGLPHIDLTQLPTLFFALFAVLFAGEAVKRISTIWLYRTQSAHG